MMNRDPIEAPITEHLAEIRRRMLLCIGVFLAFFVLAWVQSPLLVAFVLHPLKAVNPELRLATLTITEGFLTTLKLALACALVATLPVALWQAWRFIEPGLLEPERHWLRFLFPPMLLAFFFGAAFCYFGVLPLAVRFFLADLGSSFSPVFSYAGYVEFTLVFMLAMGAMFQTPLLMALLDGIGILPVERLREHRRHAVVGAFIVAAVLSPPDIVSQMLVAVPLVLLLEGGIWFTLACRHRFKDRAPRADIQKVELPTL